MADGRAARADRPATGGVRVQVVISGVRARTHLVHLAAYLHDLQEVERVSYVGGGTFLGQACVTTSDIHRLLRLPAGAALHLLDSPDALRALPGDPVTYLSVGAPGIRPWLALRRAAPRRPVRVVVTDEGLGTYGDWRTRRAAWRRQGGREPWTTARSLTVGAAGRGLSSARFAMYDVRRDFRLDGRIAAEFGRHVDGTRPNTDDERVVFLGSPWVELAVLDRSRYVRHVRDIAREVERRGKRLVIRPHPAEDHSKYKGYEVIDAALPAELDRAVVGASGAVGGTSTALLNLAALHGISATRVVTPGLEHLEAELGATQRALLARYLPPVVTVAG